MALGAYFMKRVTHRGEQVEVALPMFAEENEFIKCIYCEHSFKSQQGLSLHVICKHPESKNTSETSHKIDHFVQRQEAG